MEIYTQKHSTTGDFRGSVSITVAIIIWQKEKVLQKFGISTQAGKGKNSCKENEWHRNSNLIIEPVSSLGQVWFEFEKITKSANS